MRTIGKILDTLPADNLLELLREIEWACFDGHTGNQSCPSCRNDEHEGHAPDCKLKAALKKYEK